MKAAKHIIRRTLAVLLCVMLMMSNIGLPAYAEEFTPAPADTDEVLVGEDLSAPAPADTDEVLVGEELSTPAPADTDEVNMGEDLSTPAPADTDEVPMEEDLSGQEDADDLVGADLGYLTYQDYMNLIESQVCAYHGDGEGSDTDSVRFNEMLLWDDNEHFLVCNGNPPHKAFEQPHQISENGYCKVCDYACSYIQRYASDWNELREAMPGSVTTGSPS